MIKKLISVLLLAAMLLCVPVCVSAEPDYYEDHINVCHNGYTGNTKVLVDDKGTIYGGDYWIWYFGRYKFNETDTTLEYYYVGQEKLAKYAKRIFIDKTTGEYKICVYVGKSILDLFLDSCDDYVKEYIESQPYSNKLEKFIKEKYKKAYDACAEEFKTLNDGFKVLEKGKFSKMISHENAIWAPIEELLPLLGAHVDIYDNTLQIKNVTTSIWQALYGFNMDDLEFVAADKILGEQVTTPLAWVTTTIVDLRADRFDLIDKSGDINDYKKIFTNYIVDNEVYLDCFGGEDDIENQKDKDWNDVLLEMGELGTATEFFVGAVDYSMEMNQVMKLLPSGISEAVSESVGLNITADVIKFSAIISNYVYKYLNQVEDHRLMLMELYEDCFAQAGSDYHEISERRGCPSYKAAFDISETYGEGTGKLLQAIIEEFKHEFDTKIIKDVVLGKVKPAVVVFDITVSIMKFLDPESYERLQNMSNLKKIDKICKASTDGFNHAVAKNDYSKGWLDRLRRMGLMATLTSRHAFKAYSVGDSETLGRLKEHMVDFYMSAESIQFCEKNYVKDTTAAIKSKYKDLKVLDGDGQVGVDKKHYECYAFIAMNLDEVLRYSWDSFRYNYEKGSDGVKVNAVYGASSLEIYADFHKPSDYMTEDYKFDPADFMVHTVTVPETAPDGAYIAYGIRKGMTYDEMAALLAAADMKMPFDTYETEDTSQLPFGTVKYGYIYPKNCYGYIGYHIYSRDGYKIRSMAAHFDPMVGAPDEDPDEKPDEKPVGKFYECYKFIEMSLDEVQKLEWDSFRLEHDKGSYEVTVNAVYGDSYLEMYAITFGSNIDAPGYEFNPKDFTVVEVKVPENAPDDSYIACGIRKGMTVDDIKGIGGVFIYSNSDGTGMASLYPKDSGANVNLDFTERKLSGKINYAKAMLEGFGG